MSRSPKENEETFMRVLNALKDLAPDVNFNGKGVAELEAQVNKSMAPRHRLAAIKNEETDQIGERETEDAKTDRMIEQLVAGVIGHDDFGPDSPLYEAFGFVRKSKRKSGNTRRGGKNSKPAS